MSRLGFHSFLKFGGEERSLYSSRRIWVQQNCRFMSKLSRFASRSNVSQHSSFSWGGECGLYFSRETIIKWLQIKSRLLFQYSYLRREPKHGIRIPYHHSSLNFIFIIISLQTPVPRHTWLRSSSSSKYTVRDNCLLNFYKSVPPNAT